MSTAPRAAPSRDWNGGRSTTLGMRSGVGGGFPRRATDEQASSTQMIRSFTRTLMQGTILPDEEVEADKVRGSSAFLTAERSRLARNMSVSERIVSQRLHEARVIEKNLEASDDIHELPLKMVEARFKTSTARGLSQDEARQRFQTSGPNELDQEVPTPLWKLFLAQFKNLLIVILIFAAAGSIFLKEYAEGVAVFITVLINAGIATYTEQSASSALAALANMSQPFATVIRNGQPVHVPTRECVPGDIVVLETGDVVPADLRLIRAAGLKVTEASLTGEADDVPKRATEAGLAGTEGKLTAPNMVFSATQVASGQGAGIVVATGMNTRLGTVAKLLKANGAAGSSAAGTKAKTDGKGASDIEMAMEGAQSTDGGSERDPPLGESGPEGEDSHRTPLQRKLHRLGLLISICAIIACSCVFVFGLIRKQKDPAHPERGSFLVSITLAVSLAVSAIPESLPLCVTICLALGTRDMSRLNALVRKLPAVETLGSAEVICSDKTGTISEGKMTTVRLWASGAEFQITGKGYSPFGDIQLKQVSVLRNAMLLAPEGRANAEGMTRGVECADGRASALLRSSLLCSTAQLAVNPEKGAWEVIGNATEAAVVVAAARAGMWKSDALERMPLVATVPFTSDRKMMLTLHRLPSSGPELLPGTRGKQFTAVVKGAPHYVVQRCTHAPRADGSPGMEALGNLKEHALAAVDEYSSEALRVLAVAVRAIEELPAGLTPSAGGALDVDGDVLFADAAKSMTLLGLVANRDPPRDGVANSVRRARTAGVRTVMITGDYLKTAVAIAKDVLIIQAGEDEEHLATDCEALRPSGTYMHQSAIDEITSRVVVFARARPEDKIEIVKSLRRQGLVTAMTGDGVNDAPALKEADIGVAMGLQGTEVAKGASDMILTDDNFSTMISAVEKGRVIYQNIQLFITYLLGTNVSQVFIVLFCTIAGLPAPVMPLSILLFNLAVDSCPAMMMSVERGDETVMKRSPNKQSAPIIGRTMWIQIIIHSIGLFSIVMTSYMFGLYHHAGSVFLTEGDPCRSFSFGDGWTSETRDPKCIERAVSSARTMAFLTLGMCEIVRAYTVRQLAPVWHKAFRNSALNKACALSFCIFIAVAVTPGIRDVCGLRIISPSYAFIAVSLVGIVVFMDEVGKAWLRWDIEHRARHSEQVISGSVYTGMMRNESVRNSRANLNAPLLSVDEF